MFRTLYPAYRLKRHKLFVSCATIAITVALTPQRTWAQAYQGTPTTTGSSVFVVKVTDAAGKTDTHQLAIKVVALVDPRARDQ